MGDTHTIHQTRDYALFKYVAGNRDVKKSHIERLSKSILSNNMMDVFPIIVNEDFEVIDGQTRLEVAKLNKLPVYYTVISHADLENVHLLNVNVKPWSITDFLKSYCVLGKEDYKTLRDFSETYKLSIGICLSLFTGSSITQGGSPLIKHFKEGTFKITHGEEALTMVRRLERLKPLLEDKVSTSRLFIEALRIAYTHVDPNELEQKIGSRQEKIGIEAGVSDYLRVLEDIYNHGRKIDNFIRFF